MKIKGFYFITDSALSRKGIFQDVKNALQASVEIVQYRQKNNNSKEMYEEALSLRKICQNIIFIVNDRIDIALAVGADGVHLGQEDLPCASARKILGKNRIIGVTVHTLKQAKEAQRNKADYLGASPIFRTSTKPDAGSPKGIELIRDIKKQVSVPLIAIGGINLDNAVQVVNAGADGLCAISAILTKPDIRKEIEKFQRLFAIM